MEMQVETDYANPGFGLVLENMTTADTIMNLFDQKSFWTSTELNEIVGWQFSQGIFTLRRRLAKLKPRDPLYGAKIKTVHINGNKYGYRFVKPAEDEKDENQIVGVD